VRSAVNVQNSSAGRASRQPRPSKILVLMLKLLCTHALGAWLLARQQALAQAARTLAALFLACHAGIHRSTPHSLPPPHCPPYLPPPWSPHRYRGIAYMQPINVARRTLRLHAAS
jgi:hypothetical protein